MLVSFNFTGSVQDECFLDWLPFLIEIMCGFWLR